jgi:hypothetical protein
MELEASFVNLHNVGQCAGQVADAAIRFRFPWPWLIG